MSPVSSGSRSASSTRAGNSGASSRNSTPACAREIAPGWARPGPPPTTAAVEAVWWGFSKGGVVRSPPRASNRPSTERIAETVWASWASSGGRMLGRREAIMVLPVPGGPVSSRWWAPAAATSAARRARAWPRTSAKSGRRVAGSVPAGSGSAGTGGALAGEGGTAAAKRWRSSGGAPGAGPGRAGRAGRAGRGGGEQSRRDPGARPHPAAQTQRPQQHEIRGDGGEQVALGVQHGHRDREIEAGAVLGPPGRAHVDGDPPCGEVDPAAGGGRAHAIPGLERGAVGQPDHGERGQPRGDVGLDLHEGAVEAGEADREGACVAHQHTASRCSSEKVPSRWAWTATTSIRTSRC